VTTDVANVNIKVAVIRRNVPYIQVEGRPIKWELKAIQWRGTAKESRDNKANAAPPGFGLKEVLRRVLFSNVVVS